MTSTAPRPDASGRPNGAPGPVRPPAPDPVPPTGAGFDGRQAVLISFNVLFFLLLMVMAWGDVRGFFAHPVRMSVVALHLLMIPVMTLCTSGRSRGQRHVRDAPQFFPLLVVHSLATAWLMPWMDARDLWVLPGGDVLRWTGLAALALGVALRMASMIVLGRRFSGLVSLQAGHRLQVSGLYARIRHPSYLGILLIDIGFVGVFRSAVALALLPAVMVMLKLRMDREERFMERAFEAEYRDYRARTWRLVPGVY